ncbi:MAG: CoA-binding protein, partial [Planctomycetota bacterium]
MAIQNLDKIFRPESIAVVGASGRSESVGHTVLKNLLAADFNGPIYPINPSQDEVLGRETYKTVGQAPTAADLAVVCTPAAAVPDVIRQCGENGVDGVVVLSAGFREAGDEGKQLEAALLAELRRWSDMRLIGPNCLGVLSPRSRVNASFADAMPNSGRVAFISQSGALCTSVLDWSLSAGIGFSHVVSIGNALDVNFGDLIDYFSEDPTTAAIVLYVESINEARNFMSAARAFTHSMPIVVYKAGRFDASAQAAARGVPTAETASASSSRLPVLRRSLSLSSRRKRFA